MMRAQQSSSLRTHFLAGVGVVALLVFGFGGLASQTEFSGAVVAPGTLVVDSNVKAIQHPTGGVVSELLVRNGDHVRAGQVLVRLDETQARANLTMTVNRLAELDARQARCEAERDGLDSIQFPAELLSHSDDPDVERLIEAQKRLFQIRRDAREGQKAQLHERIAQLSQEVEGLKTQEQSKLDEVAWIRKELDGVMTLWKKNLVQLTRVVALQRDLARAEGEHGQLIAMIAENKSKVAEIEIQMIQVDQDLRSEVGKDLAQIRALAAETMEQKLAAQDVLSRVDIIAPQDGVVHDMTVHTVGGVVKAGEKIMKIVPTGDKLDIDARVPPQWIDQVKAGQSAAVRFPQFDAHTTPEVRGSVTLVSADLVQDHKTNEHFYTVRVAIPSDQLAIPNAPLVPGMPADVFIQTDSRTIISYLVKPLRDQLDRESQR